jgi:ribonuclease-3
MVSGDAISEGIGKSKREAEQSAARTAYELLSQPHQ